MEQGHKKFYKRSTMSRKPYWRFANYLSGGFMLWSTKVQLQL